jgi:hypothetical protein
MIHLNTLVGGRSVATLLPMLEHYQRLGVESYLINVHLSERNDPILEEVRAITRHFGVPISSVFTGNWLEVLRRVYRESRQSYPDDWHILADQDEFQVYPMKLPELETMCNEKKYDYVCGCWVDRFAASGAFLQVDSSRSIWEQFPIGAFLSYPIAAADPRKVVFARSNVDVCVGQHFAWNGRGCPIDEVFVQVHHFKWVNGIIAELERRALLLKQSGYKFNVESTRFVKFFKENGGLANLKDRRILTAECGEDYIHWPVIRKWLILLNNYIEIGGHFIPGPSCLSENLVGIEMATNALLSNIRSRKEVGCDRTQHEDPTFGLEPVRQIWLNSRH